jgi:cysteine-rich repeat protein
MVQIRTLAFFILFLLVFPASAAEIRHTYGGDSTNSFYLDDQGGSLNNGGSNNSYFLNLQDIDQSTFGTLLLSSNDGIEATVEDGLVDEDFADGGGIFLRPLSILDPDLDGEIGLGSDSLLLPVTFTGDDSGLIVEQVSYTSNDPADRFIILEYRVINPTTGAVQAQLALANDFDVDLKSADATVGYDDSVVPLVYQQEAPPLDPESTTVGTSLIEGSLARYRLEACSGAFGFCEIFADDGDAIRKAFFQNTPGQVGDLTGGASNQDFAVTIAANLGSIPAGGSASAVFCYNLGNGGSTSEGLADCQNSVQNCRAFYETEIQICGNGLVNFGEQCDDANTSNQDDCPSDVDGACQNARCGDGFLWTQGAGNEECDDGNTSNNDLCTNACRAAVCGDGFPQPALGEECDDGNSSNSDACCDCQNARCGDGFLRVGVEVCDDGNNNNGDGCAADCRTIETCGDGDVDPPFESCDDGNDNNHDACPDGPAGTCQAAFCGDGHLRIGVEECDDGNSASGDGCAACLLENSAQTPGGSPVCGNEIVEAGEDCDGGFGCEPNCRYSLVLQGGGATNREPGTGGCSLIPVPFSSSPIGLGSLSLGLMVLFGTRLRRSPPKPASPRTRLGPSKTGRG